MSKVQDILSYLKSNGTTSSEELAYDFDLAKVTVERYLRKPEVTSKPGFAKSRGEDGKVYYTYVEANEYDVIEIFEAINEGPRTLSSLKAEFGEALTEAVTDDLLEDGKIHELTTLAGTTWYTVMQPTSDYLQFKGSIFKRTGNLWTELSDSEVTSKKWELA